ncbi:uncharacterized protein K444DRAFT_632356 [Hyaloscypha bicolor E]|uniref:Uncharacterized protein n=1 Tax=Hyaloscypha bicolor E TaxID=1095630 RepID=A0A2J6T2I1_9HELO|nr:uncharacterized protein K444DRAFT_632356 [Hyaloscypha bicolor E]PMD57226.1 hypothetical protein K444DRAFT_632356 [Hyaloscypha bicolor E]
MDSDIARNELRDAILPDSADLEGVDYTLQPETYGSYEKEQHGFEFSTGNINEHHLAGAYNSPEELFVHFFKQRNADRRLLGTSMTSASLGPQQNSQNLKLGSFAYNFRRQQADRGIEWDWDRDPGSTKNPTSLKRGSTLCKFRFDIMISTITFSTKYSLKSQIQASNDNRKFWKVC